MTAASPRELRERMVGQVLAAGRPVSPAVTAALRAVPRHVFLPGLDPADAYRDEAIVTKRNAGGEPVSSSSQPTIMAIMLDQLALTPGHRVLEIGAGTGYNAALMKHIVGPGGGVVTVDLDEDITAAARVHLAAAGCPDITVVCGDGADGYPAQAPYDRVIATVGVSDLAPAWLAQLAPGGRIVVPLDLRGVQRSVAFERAGGHWESRSAVPCGFMRMRGPSAGPERMQVSQDGVKLAVMLPDGRPADPGAIARALAGPGAEHIIRITAHPPELFDGLGLWLALHEPRWGVLSWQAPAGGPDPVSGLARAPARVQDRMATAGIFTDGSFAVLARAAGTSPPPARRDRLRWPAPVTLCTLGYGPGGAGLGAALAAHAEAWDAGGRPGTGSLRISAYPAPGPGGSPAGETVISRPHTAFTVSAAGP